MTETIVQSATSSQRETILLGLLCGCTTVLAGVLLARGLASWLEAVSFVTGAICVWLTVRENVWNFPIGMVNVATFFVLFLRTRLFADAGLQVVYFFPRSNRVVHVDVWREKGRTRLDVNPAMPARRIGVGASVVTMWIALFFTLRAMGGASPLWDALTTSISLGAQWLTDRKNWESWLLWIVVDVIYVPLYASRALYLTAALYAVFLVMAIIGLLRWRRALHESLRELPV